MKKNILEGLLKRIREKVGKEKEEEQEQEKGDSECTSPCTFPDCNEPLHGEVQKCSWLKSNGNGGMCCTRPN